MCPVVVMRSGIDWSNPQCEAIRDWIEAAVTKRIAAQ